RRRIASNLHDGAGQTLALAQMRLARARLGVGPPWRADLEACERLLEDADAQIRRVTFDLSPPVLYDLGLKPALEWLAEQMNELYGLSVEVGGDRDLDLEPATAAVAYRAVRELLTNVAKHGRVRDAKVKLRQEGASVKIVVEDHGIGIDTETSKRTDSFGLFSINEQVVRLHGTLDVQSTPTRGTTVTIVIPSGHPSGQRSRSS
ncbi:MAG TPA: sensor histidine kinase, partial [Polyangiaceae bacterium]|nr:sensor histidine kinase [Polyangiaceae bacterium]